MSRGGSTLTRSSVRERSLESWTRPLPLPASPLGSGTRSDGRCAAASGVPSCPLPEPHRRRPSPVPPSVSLSPVSCALPEQHSALPHAPSADESPTSWRSLESFHHHAHTRVESARIAPPWLSCPPGPPLGRLSPKRSTRYMVFSRLGPNQSIEISSGFCGGLKSDLYVVEIQEGRIPPPNGLMFYWDYGYRS